MLGRFTTRRVVAPELVPAAAPEPMPVSELALPPEPVEPPPDPAVVSTRLLTEKLLDAKVRLHRRLIEEINLSALEKMPEEEIRRQVHRMVSQYVLSERLALNAQELENFVDEILDENDGARPDRAAAQGCDGQRHPDQWSRMRLCRARRRARAHPGALQGLSLIHI